MEQSEISCASPGRGGGVALPHAGESAKVSCASVAHGAEAASAAHGSGAAPSLAGGEEAPELRSDGEGLALFGHGMELRGDFSRMLPRVKPGKLERELLVRAAKVKGARAKGKGTCNFYVPVAIDATAGLGEDSFLLAAAGFTVYMYERDPVIAALLRDALHRAAAAPELADIASRMKLFEQDSLGALGSFSAPIDVVYLDPMFPARGKSAAVKKKFQLLHCLENPCDDAEAQALLRAAVEANPRKVIVKRPPKGAYLAGVKPSYSLEGKAVRYDCIDPASCPRF